MQSYQHLMFNGQWIVLYNESHIHITLRYSSLLLLITAVPLLGYYIPVAC